MAIFLYLHAWRLYHPLHGDHNRRNRQKYDFRRRIEDGYPPYIIAQYLLNAAKTNIRIRISSVNNIFD